MCLQGILHLTNMIIPKVPFTIKDKHLFACENNESTKKPIMYVGKSIFPALDTLLEDGEERLH